MLWGSIQVAVVVAAGVAGGPIPLSALRVLDVEIDGGLVFVRMDTSEHDDGAAKCGRIAPKVKATFNGAPLTRMTGLYVGGDLQYNRDCLLELTFPIDKPPGSLPANARWDGPASIRIDEGDTHLALEVPDAFRPRRLVMVSPADGVLRPGQHVKARWQPASDDISQAEIAIARPGARVEDWLTIRKAALAIHGDLIEFDLPAKVPDRLRGQVEVRLIGTAYVQPRFSPCPVRRCQVHLTFDAAPAVAQLR